MPPADTEARRPLKRFAYAVGGTQFILYIAMIVYSIILLKRANQEGPTTEPCIEEDDDNTTLTNGTTTESSTTENAFLKGFEQYPLILPLVYLLLSIICFITVIIMLFGLAKNSPEFLLPWIMFHIVAVLVILCIGVFRLTRKTPDETHNDVDCVLYMFYAGIHFVVIWFIYMLYRIMSEDAG